MLDRSYRVRILYCEQVLSALYHSYETLYRSNNYICTFAYPDKCLISTPYNSTVIWCDNGWFWCLQFRQYTVLTEAIDPLEAYTTYALQAASPLA